MGLSLKRLESQALRDLAILLRNDVKGKNLSNVIVTEVRITNDLSYMTIYYSFYNGKAEDYQELLESAAPYIRSSLAKSLNPRKMPELIFKFDTSLEYGNHINEVISKLNKQ
jgi:ribosome-binding factor A